MTARLRASLVCVHQGKVLLVRLEDPASRRSYLFPPGGKIEPGESPLAAAERETLEETGYRVQADAKSEKQLLYPFVWNGTVYQCTTHFFRARLLSTTAEPIAADPIHRGVEWLPLSEIDAAFAYHQELHQLMLELIR